MNSAPETLPAPFDRQVQLFTGKGGVGKTSIVLALALAAAERGARPLIVELGHRASVETILSSEPIGYVPREIAAGVEAMNVQLDDALEDYITAQVKVRRVARAITENAGLRRFFHAAPAVPEVATLHKLERLADMKRRGAPRYDPILVDLDATGHARMFLELPKVFEGLAESGPLRRILDGFSALLRDSEKTALHLVTLPAELPATETLELYRDLAAAGSVQLGSLVINAVPRPPQGPLGGEREAVRAGLEALSQLDAAGRADAVLARRYLAEVDAAYGRIAWLRERVALPTFALPSIDDAMDREQLRELGELLFSAAGERS